MQRNGPTFWEARLFAFLLKLDEKNDITLISIQAQPNWSKETVRSAEHKDRKQGGTANLALLNDEPKTTYQRFWSSEEKRS